MTEATVTTEAQTPTAEELAALFDSLPGEFKDTINKVNTAINSHNGKVDSIKSADAQDPKLIKAEIFEQNTTNESVVKLRQRELKLIEQIEKIRAEGYSLIESEGLMPKDLSEEELTKLKSEVTESSKELRDSVSALVKFEELMPTFKGKIAVHIHEIKTRRGTAKTGTTGSGEGPKRIRFKRLLVNGVTQDDSGNKVFGVVGGEEKYTFTFASKYIAKQHKGIKWTANDMTAAYLEGLDENNLPDKHEFVMTHEYNDAQGNGQTVNYTVTAER